MMRTSDDLLDATERVPRVLCIAGTDPTGGAGIQADLKSVAANGGYGMAVVTALVAQNTTGVRSVHVPPISFLAEQLDAVSDDVQMDAVKIGMLANAAVIDAVASWLERVRPPIVVLDPVMVATSGDRLLDADSEQALRSLIGRVDLITPNVPELAVLAGEVPATSWSGVVAQARQVSESYGVMVLAKGGHVTGESAPDALVDSSCSLGGGRDVVELMAPRIETTNTHGTGCSFSSAIATLRPVVDGWEEAVADAKLWLTESIRHGAELHVGHGHGPISHFAGLWARGGTRTHPTAASVATQWWNDVEDLRIAIGDLSFVRSLGDGTLERDAFEWYLAQDALYLRDYSRVLAEASRHAPTVEEQAFWAASAHGSLAAELQLHTSRLDVDTRARAKPSRVTVAYLDHLLATAARGDYAVLTAALLPCFWLYSDLGSRLGPLGGDGHPYADWLRTYADTGFAEATRQAIGIVTKAAATSGPGRRQAMWAAFRASSEHELAFFAAPLAERKLS